MSKVLFVHTIELHPGVKGDDFEKFVIEEVYPLTPEGGETLLLKGREGERVGKYALLVETESADVHNPVGRSAETRMVLEKFATLATIRFTDYVVIRK